MSVHNLASNEVPMPQYNAIARMKGKFFVMYDASMFESMKHLNWESDDPRINITPALAAKFPRLNRTSGRIKLADFVWSVIAGRELPDGMMAASVNFERRDVRLENLVLLPDLGRGQKGPKSTMFNADLVGELSMRFMPKGLTVSKNGPTAHMFVVKYMDVEYDDAQIKKFSFKNPVQAEQIFRDKVLPFLHTVIEDFNEHNTPYQRLCNEYHDVHNIISAKMMADEAK